MADGFDTLTLTAHRRIAEISADEWDNCAGADNPFVAHAFLLALEESGSVSGKTGWLPQHMALRDGAGALIACAPLYIKSHSYGEYVFDWSWAQAYERAGGRYYPKLQVCVPFTPATGPRLLTGPLQGERCAEARRLLVAGMLELCERIDGSSVHITFPAAEEAESLQAAGLMRRVGQQYHWENRGYESFDDFLAGLSSRKRKTLRKEREKANAQGVRFLTLSGEQIEGRHWDAFYRFYLSTVDRKWANAYLRRGFFDLLGQRMADRVVLVMGEVEASGELVCGALNLRGGDTLYGRNWGADGAWKFLHFEACYYRAMDYAIAHGLRWVEAGAQGEHKVQRGYLPRQTYSAHYITDPGLREAVAEFLVQEERAVAEDMEALRACGPYREGV
jgi:predicted N-acyltransferase